MTDRVPERHVSREKITAYLLNPDHEKGGPKSVFFVRFGFSADRWSDMAAALIGHPERNAVEEVVRERWGTKYVVRCTVATPDGRDPCILTIWTVPPGDQIARFVTAYPADV